MSWPFRRDPTFAVRDTDDLARSFARELTKLENLSDLVLPNPLPVSHKEPTKKPTAADDKILFAFADGTDWNPGTGRGLYYWDSGLSAWKKVTVT